MARTKNSTTPGQSPDYKPTWLDALEADLKNPTQSVPEKKRRSTEHIRDEYIEGMARLGCTQEEIAAILCISARTINRNFIPAYERGRSSLRYSIRKCQIEKALGLSINGRPALPPDTTMLIFLGKNLCGQSSEPQSQGGDSRDLERMEGAPSWPDVAARMDASIPRAPRPEDNGGNGSEP